LRRAGNADAIPNLDAANLGSYGLDDTHAAVPLDEREIVRVRSRETDGRRIVSTCCGRSGLETKDGADVRIAKVCRLRADDHLTS
jgi:hypothetical protein